MLIAVAFVIVLPSADSAGRGVRVVVAALCAAAMGMQNTAARRLAVPDLTTTVLTMTLTGIVADIGNSPRFTTASQALAGLTMALRAVVGAQLILHTRLASALGDALVLLAIVVVVATVASRGSAPWQAAAARA